MTTTTTTTLALGDLVAYARTHLRSIADYSYDSASRRGTITAIRPMRGTAHVVAEVRWLDDGTTLPVLSCNLVRADRLHLEPR